MNILFVASRFPYPPYNGDQVRAFHQIRVLSRRHDVVLLAQEPSGDRGAAIAAMRPYCRHIELVPRSDVRALFRLAGAPFTSLPLQTLWFYNPELSARAEALCRCHAIDLAHIQLIRLGPVVEALPQHVATVLDYIDALSVNMTRRAERSRGVLKSVAAREARAVLRYERELVERFDELVISSAPDRLAIGDYDKVHVVANGVDLSHHILVEGGRAPNTVVFSGTMWYFPNVDGARWLIEEVLPRVRAERPDIRFQLVGARPTRAVRALAQVPGVEVTGRVESVHAYVSRAAVAVAPMRSGSGGQFKVIEAMAAGTPVVATPLALGGFDARHDEHLLVASDADSFARGIVRLLGDRALRDRLTAAGHALVRERYSWETTVNELEHIYAAALATPRGTARAPTGA